MGSAQLTGLRAPLRGPEDRLRWRQRWHRGPRRQRCAREGGPRGLRTRFRLAPAGKYWTRRWAPPAPLSLPALRRCAAARTVCAATRPPEVPERRPRARPNRARRAYKRWRVVLLGAPRGRLFPPPSSAPQRPLPSPRATAAPQHGPLKPIGGGERRSVAAARPQGTAREEHSLFAFFDPQSANQLSLCTLLRFVCRTPLRSTASRRAPRRCARCSSASSPCRRAATTRRCTASRSAGSTCTCPPKRCARALWRRDLRVWFPPVPRHRRNSPRAKPPMHRCGGARIRTHGATPFPGARARVETGHRVSLRRDIHLSDRAFDALTKEQCWPVDSSAGQWTAPPKKPPPKSHSQLPVAEPRPPTQVASDDTHFVTHFEGSDSACPVKSRF